MDHLDDGAAGPSVGILGEAGNATGTLTKHLKQFEASNRLPRHADAGKDRGFVHRANHGLIQHRLIRLVVLKQITDLALKRRISAAPLL
ncbi:MAG: hypothetical protein ACREJD_06000 [Phycisphaerales bacterium]